jgi:hypothetical protein
MLAPRVDYPLPSEPRQQHDDQTRPAQPSLSIGPAFLAQKAGVANGAAAEAKQFGRQTGLPMETTSGKKILIVQDERDIVGLLTFELRKVGY